MKLEPVLSVAQVDAFHRDGFVNGGAILGTGEVGALGDALAALVETGPDAVATDDLPVLFRDLAALTRRSDSEGTGEERPVWQIVNVWLLSEPFRELLAHPKLVAAVAQLTGSDDLQVWHDQAQIKPARWGGCTTWHQDAPLWPALEPATQVTAWISFDDADLENGAMWMVPGSHRWGDRIRWLSGEPQRLRRAAEFGNLRFEPPDGESLRPARVCPVRVGEVHFHHGLTWHGSPENPSERRRHALGIHYMPAGVKYTGKGHPISSFIRARPGAPMTDAGPSFPIVLRAGELCAGAPEGTSIEPFASVRGTP